jgi:hypothetical protein
MSNIDRTDYTFSNIDWAALNTEAFNPPVSQSAMTPAEAEAAAALAGGGIPLNRPFVAETPPVEQPTGGGTQTVEEEEPQFVRLPREIAPIVQPPASQTPIEPPAPPAPDPEAAKRAARASARPMAEILTDYLKPYFSQEDLDVLLGVAIDKIVEFGQDLAPAMVPIELKKTTQYKTRFAANAKRIEKGLPELSPAEYVSLEQTYRDLFKAYGMPDWSYDETNDFEKILENNIQPAEMNRRIVQGFNAVKTAPPEVIKQFKDLYDIDESNLAAYFLDPTRGAEKLVRQAEAAQVAGIAKQAGGITLGATAAEAASFAERIAAEGIAPSDLQAGFARIAEQQGLFRPLMRGEEQISQQEQVEGTLGINAAARQRIEARRRRRQAEFQEGGGFAETAQGVIGLRTVGE